MEDIKQMKNRHKMEIEELQENCKHEKISEWVDFMWAPGHYGGQVKVCKFCGKIIKEQKTFNEDKIIDAEVIEIE